MRILYKFATRSRPEKFFACLDNICQEINDKENYQILVSADNDDPTMAWENIRERCIKFENQKIKICFGSSLNKIHAINRNIEVADNWDILINTSDDMWFDVPGFDDIIRQDMITNFPDLDGVLHYNDGNQKANVMTLSIMGRKYYDRFHYIYHPHYKSLWSDCEATEVAKLLGKYKYMGDETILFRHLHPAWGLAPSDEQYRKTEAPELWRHDENVYRKRKAFNFYL